MKSRPYKPSAAKDCRPLIQITGYVNERQNRYAMTKVYCEYPNIPKTIDHISFPTLEGLNREIENCIAEAKENTYDYRLCLVSPGVKL